MAILNCHSGFRFPQNQGDLGFCKPRLFHPKPPVPVCQKVLFLDGVFSWESYESAGLFTELWSEVVYECCLRGAYPESVATNHGFTRENWRRMRLEERYLSFDR